MAAISNDWLEPLQGEFKKPYYKKLYDTVLHEYQTRKIFPAPDDIFNAFSFTPLANVKVVILGQDPYHNDGQAHGLSFSVKPDIDIPPSLVNIYQELHDDLGCYIPNNGYLKKWADQGKKLKQTNKKSCFSGNMTNFGNGWVSCNRAVFQNNEQHTINDQCSCYYICVIQMSFHPVIK